MPVSLSLSLSNTHTLSICLSLSKTHKISPPVCLHLTHSLSDYWSLSSPPIQLTWEQLVDASDDDDDQSEYFGEGENILNTGSPRDVGAVDEGQQGCEEEEKKTLKAIAWSQFQRSVVLSESKQ